MQRYFNHLEESRKRFDKAAKKFSEPGTSVYIRGATQLTLAPEDVHNPVPVPVYAGTLSYFSKSKRGAILEASVRKSASYAIEHLYVHEWGSRTIKMKNNSEHFVKWLSMCPELSAVPVLALLHSTLHDLTHLHEADSRIRHGSRKDLQVALVGTREAPTLRDMDHRAAQLDSMLSQDSTSTVLIALAPSEIHEAAALSLAGQAIEETRELLKSLHTNHLVEGFKRANSAPAVHRFCIEVEITMVEKMLEALEST